MRIAYWQLEQGRDTYLEYALEEPSSGIVPAKLLRLPTADSAQSSLSMESSL